MVTRRTKPETRRSAPRPAAGAKRSRGARTPTIPKRKPGEDLFEFLIRLGDSMPPEVAAMFPPDSSWNMDHYIYGTPKKPYPPASE